MMNVSINRDDYGDDYDSYEKFLVALKKALRYKGHLFSKQAANTLDTNNMYKSVLPDYLYYRLFEEMSEPVEGTYTKAIIVRQEGGKGGYFFKHGLLRKPTKPVEFKVYPPLNLFINNVTMNDTIINQTANNIFNFYMPNNNANVTINYSTVQPETITVYWGISYLENIPVVPQQGQQIILPANSAKVTVPFLNSNKLGWIWVASPKPIEYTKWGEGTLEDGLIDEISGAFNTPITSVIDGITYYLYLHSWKTGLNNLTFLFE